MDIQHGNTSGTARTITGEFLCTQQEPVSDTTTTTARGKKVSKIPSHCELNCDNGSLSIYILRTRSLLLTLSNICRVTRNRHDKEYFCLEYGTEKDRFHIFLTIVIKSDADDWEYELCKITGQTPPCRRRLQTEASRRKRPIKEYTLSSPGAPQGFSLGTEQEDLNDVPAQDDDNDGTPVDEHNDDELPTSHSGSQEGESSTSKSTRTNSNGQQKAEVVVTVTQAEPQETRQRDGQREPVESHIGEVIGYENVSPTPRNSPSCRLSDEVQDNNDSTKKVLEKASQTLLERKQQQQQKRELDLNDDKPSDILPLTSENEPISSVIGMPQPLDQRLAQPLGELRSTEVSSQHAQCTYMEIKCSEDKLNVEVNKEDFLSTGEDINDIFVGYLGSVYLKSCPENLQHKLFIGTRILLVNKQEPYSADRAIEYITTSAGKTVNFLVQLYPLGVCMQLRVTSFADLGIELHGKDITNMRRDSVMSKIADGLRCMTPALSTSDTPHTEQLSITAIGNHHVPHDASTEEVEDMLTSAINRGSLVLQLHPTEFCHAIAPDALQRRHFMDEDAVLNPRPTRKLSLVRSLMSNPPS